MQYGEIVIANPDSRRYTTVYDRNRARDLAAEQGAEIVKYIGRRAIDGRSWFVWSMRRPT